MWSPLDLVWYRNITTLSSQVAFSLTGFWNCMVKVSGGRFDESRTVVFQSRVDYLFIYLTPFLCAASENFSFLSFCFLKWWQPLRKPLSAHGYTYAGTHSLLSLAFSLKQVCCWEARASFTAFWDKQKVFSRDPAIQYSQAESEIRSQPK